MNSKYEKKLKEINNEEFDILIIGGGATGLGIAVDAVTRGYKTLLIEKFDFAKGTSSRSSKLIHGGVRYLAQKNISLVKTALKEKALLSELAPHLISPCAFITPIYNIFTLPYYYFGLNYYYNLLVKIKILSIKLNFYPRIIQ